MIRIGGGWLQVQELCGAYSTDDRLLRVIWPKSSETKFLANQGILNQAPGMRWVCELNRTDKRRHVLHTWFSCRKLWNCPIGRSDTDLSRSWTSGYCSNIPLIYVRILDSLSDRTVVFTCTSSEEENKNTMGWCYCVEISWKTTRSTNSTNK